MTELPIACTLAPSELRGRLELIDALARDALTGRRPIAGGVRASFRDTAGIEARVRELVAAESQCCAFLHFAVHRGDEALLLDITGPPDAQPVIERFFPLS